MARIVLNPFGSLGDLHPYLAIAIELQRRGHTAVIATSEVYRSKVQAEGVGFAPVRPDAGELLGNAALMDKIMHPRRGSEYLIRDYLLPQVGNAYEDLNAACDGADLLVTHVAGYAGPIVAEARNLPWISVALQPAIFFSTYDPSVLASAPWLRHLHNLGRWPFAALHALIKWHVQLWTGPIVRLRRKLGLPATSINPVLEGFSPFGTLALFSARFARPQPDWPANVRMCGFVFYDKRDAEGAPDRGLAEFLKSGPPPVLFTLGSSAVMRPGAFYEESAAAARKLGIRALLLAGNYAPQQSSSEVYVTDYASYSEIMSRVAASVHSGGVGTCAQAMRSGRPMLVVPWSHDQPDNAERLRNLGVSRTIERSRYTAATASPELDRLLNEPSYETAATQIARELAKEDGLSAACDSLEAALSNQSTLLAD
ncbi:MAG TPA: glycosyltransferase [Bryobacteraceae bacterium]